MAVFDRSCTRVTDDACKCLNVRVFLGGGLIFCILDISKSCSWINHTLNFVSCRGNVVIETNFYDDDLHVSTSRVRLFYVWDMEPCFVFFTVTPDDGPITTSLNSQRRHSTYRVFLLRRCDNSIKGNVSVKPSFKTNGHTSFMADKDLYIRAIMLMTTWLCKLPVCIFSSPSIIQSCDVHCFLVSCF